MCTLNNSNDLSDLHLDLLTTKKITSAYKASSLTFTWILKLVTYTVPTTTSSMKVLLVLVGCGTHL